MLVQQRFLNTILMVGKLVIKDVRNALLIILPVICVIQVVLCGKHFIGQFTIAMNYRTMQLYRSPDNYFMYV